MKKLILFVFLFGCEVSMPYTYNGIQQDICDGDCDCMAEVTFEDLRWDGCVLLPDDNYIFQSQLTFVSNRYLFRCYEEGVWINSFYIVSNFKDLYERCVDNGSKFGPSDLEFR